MNIIFVSNSMAKPRVFTLPQLLGALAFMAALVVIFTTILILPQSNTQHQGVKSLIPSALHIPLLNSQEHIDALAIQLGEIQARVMRLDAQSDRLSTMAGIKDKDAERKDSGLADPSRKMLPPGQGGPQVKEYGLTEEQLNEKVNELMLEVEHKSDRLSMLETLLVQQSMQKNAIPNTMPVNSAYNSSSYGWRVDPFTGKMAFHEGLDFTAEVGTPIYAAAGGIVTSAEQTPDYGKIIKIDHGSGLETRYAHTSMMLVKAGDRVEKGQMIAQVGNTGRSTGPHLHFEVRLNGAPLDPRSYLTLNQAAMTPK
ncbi:MAG TPA: M23 family metallopeptidase [Methyloradius sp.]